MYHSLLVSLQSLSSMDSSLPSILLLLIVLSIVLTLGQSSTIGVQYISRLLEIQDHERAPPSVQVAAAYGALQRLLPSYSSAFEFRIISKVYNFCLFSDLRR